MKCGRFPKNRLFFKKLAASSKQRRLKVLQKASREEIVALIEVIYNVVTCSLKISNQEKSVLQKNCDELRHFAKIRDSVIAKKELVQSGGAFLVPLLKLVFKRLK